MPPLALRWTRAILSISLLSTITVADLPYTPTYIFASSQSHNAPLYILDPPSLSLPNGQLRSLSVAPQINANNIQTSIISSSLPFLEHNAALSYTPALSANGSVTVYTGACSNGPSSANVWTFTPKDGSNFQQGTWNQKNIDTSSVNGIQANMGPNFLAGAAAFSTIKDQPAAIYTFGGMCPYSNASANQWTTAASYSNSMLVIQPDTSDNSFDFSLDTGTGEPIAEAGFSMTPLLPTYSQPNEVGQSQVFQDFLLLGGHTQQAFINMSQVAVFGLPQAEWTFLPVNPSVTNEDLRIRSTVPQVEPRSGHTALLTSDGSKVIVFGGWVGDVSTPAEPFLAILELGAGYGGSGAWTWAQVADETSPYENGDSVYGHGAVMLPGNIMLVTGGFGIPVDASNSKFKARAAATQTAVTQTLLYNVTSGQWISSYNKKQSASSSGSSSPLDSTQAKVGLGVGLPLGLIALGLAGLACWYITQKLRLSRQERHEELEEINEKDKEIDDLSILAHSYPAHLLAHGGIDGRGGGINAGSVWNDRPRQTSETSKAAPDANRDFGRNAWSGATIRSAERTGMDLDIPSPNRGLRRSLSGRPTLQVTGSRFDDSSRRSSHGPGTIHVIEERVEEEEEAAEADAEPEPESHRDLARSDPFRDPSPPPSPTRLSTAQRRLAGRDHQLNRSPTRSSFHGTIYDNESGGMNPFSNIYATSLNHQTTHSQNQNQSHIDSARTHSLTSKSIHERTGSNLSEYSLHSSTSNNTNTTSSKSKSTSSGPSRAPSTATAKSLRMLAVANGRLASPSPSPTHDAGSRPKTPGDAESFRTAFTALSDREHHDHDGEAESDRDANSRPSTAHSPIREDMLYQNHAQAHPSSTNSAVFTYPNPPRASSNFNFNFDPQPDSLPTFTGAGTSPTRSTSRVVGSWVGSVRRIIANANAAGSGGVGASGARTNSLTSREVGVDGLGGWVDYGSPLPNPVAAGGGGAMASPREQRAQRPAAPRRSVSDSNAPRATLQQQQQQRSNENDHRHEDTIAQSSTFSTTNTTTTPASIANTTTNTAPTTLETEWEDTWATTPERELCRKAKRKSEGAVPNVTTTASWERERQRAGVGMGVQMREAESHLQPHEIAAIRARGLQERRERRERRERLVGAGAGGAWT